MIDMDDILARLKIIKIIQPCALIAFGRGRFSIVRFTFGKDAIRLRDNDEPLNFKAAREVVNLENTIATRVRGLDMLGETLARRFKQFWMMRFICTEFCKAWKRCRLKIERRNILRRGLARVDILRKLPRTDKRFQRPVRIVFQGKDACFIW